MAFWNRTGKKSNAAALYDPLQSWNGGAVKLASCDFRDGQQSVIATRLKTEDMLPILPQMDDFGFECIEMWGGATFDACIRFLDEDPWERLRLIKQCCPKTPLRMLLRGQNLLGYTPYPDDIVERFVTKAAENGIDIFLIFDGLNDIRNCACAAKAALKAGKRVEGNIQFTSSPVHTVESFIKTAQDYVAIGATAVHLEDMGGMIDPVTAARTVAAVKTAVNVPVHYHSHCTSGMTEITYWEVIRAGADVVDVDCSAFALGTSHPAAESIIAVLKGTPRDTGLDYTKLIPISNYLREVQGHPHEYLYKIALFTGLREGEVLGLGWEHIDFQAGTLTVKRQLRREQKKGGEYYFSPPKNNKSRCLTLAPSVIQLFRLQKLQQNRMRISCICRCNRVMSSSWSSVSKYLDRSTDTAYPYPRSAYSFTF